jgi:hypothetical protein
MNHIPSLKQRRRLVSRALPISIGGLLAATALSGYAAEDVARMDKLEKENQALKARLDSLEALAKKEGIVPSGDAPKAISALTDITLSGFATASYFYNTESPNDKMSDGYLWNTRHNSFSVNKVKVTLASPALDKTKWDAGFRASLIWGEDAPIVNTGLRGTPNGLENLREAFVNINVPVGTGLDIKVGQLISLLNYESGDGGAANNNFSQGYQWFYTGNGPAAGIQAAYSFTDWLDVKLRVQNGMYAGPLDLNDGKTIMGAIGIKPMEDLWLSLIAFGGPEGQGPLGSGMTVKGASVLAGYQVTKPLNIGLELDYFNFDIGPTDADLWSAGTFINYDITEKLGIAFRAEYLDDKDGGGIKGIGPRAGAVMSPEADGDLASVTLTLNYKPTPNVKIQPEVRYDTTSYGGGFDGKSSRWTIGAGVSYLF